MSIKVNPLQNIEEFNFLKIEANITSKSENSIVINTDTGNSSANNLQTFAGQMLKAQLIQKFTSSETLNSKSINTNLTASATEVGDDEEILKETQRLIDNYRRQIIPKEIKGADPVEGGKTSGHAYPKHGVKPKVQAEIMNKPERIFSGKNDNGRYVDIYYKNGSAVITEQGDKGRVITAYGNISTKGKVKPFNLENITNNPSYVEIKLEKLGSTNVIYPNKERFDKNNFPNQTTKPNTPAKTNGGGTTGGNTEVRPNNTTQPKPDVPTNTEAPITPKSPTVNEPTVTPKPPTVSEEINGPKPTGRLSGNMVRGLAILQLVQVGLTALNYAKLKEDSGKFGYYIDPFFDKYIVADPDKAAKNLGEGFELTFYVDPTDFYNQGKSVIFTVKDGKFTNPDGWQLIYNQEKGYTEAVLLG